MPWDRRKARAHPDLNQGPADLQSAALATELCTHDAKRNLLTYANARVGLHTLCEAHAVHLLLRHWISFGGKQGLS